MVYLNNAPECDENVGMMKTWGLAHSENTVRLGDLYGNVMVGKENGTKYCCCIVGKLDTGRRLNSYGGLNVIVGAGRPVYLQGA